MKSRRMSLERHVANMAVMKNAYEILFGKALRKQTTWKN
jgi:hypothetical protein